MKGKVVGDKVRGRQGLAGAGSDTQLLGLLHSDQNHIGRHLVFSTLFVSLLRFVSLACGSEN